MSGRLDGSDHVHSRLQAAALLVQHPTQEESKALAERTGVMARTSPTNEDGMGKGEGGGQADGKKQGIRQSIKQKLEAKFAIPIEVRRHPLCATAVAGRHIVLESPSRHPASWGSNHGCAHEVCKPKLPLIRFKHASVEYLAAVGCLSPGA